MKVEIMKLCIAVIAINTELRAKAGRKNTRLLCQKYNNPCRFFFNFKQHLYYEVYSVIGLLILSYIVSGGGSQAIKY